MDSNDVNYVKLVGKIAGEIYFSMAKGGTMPLAKFKVAVQGNGKYPERISCVAFKENAESISMLTDGSSVALIGSIKNGSYVAKDGSKKYTTDIVVERIDGASKKWVEKPAPIGNASPTDEDPPF